MSSSSTVSSLAFATQQVAIYGGSFVFILGVIGGPFVLLVFLSLHTFRQSSCAFYLTVMSACNILLLWTGQLTYIMINGFGISWPNMSLAYCKLRGFGIQVCVLASFTCMCLAVIDQFLATCSNPRWHQWNNIKVARYISITVLFISAAHSIPYLIYSNHTMSAVTGRTSCSITNAAFSKYYTSVYSPILVSALPILTMIVFGLLAYRNVQQITYRTVPLVRRELDKQLTTMVLLQALCDILFILPNFIFNCYSLIVNAMGSSISAQQGSISTMLLVLYYSYFAVGIKLQ